LWSGAKSIKDRLFVVVTWNAVFFAEHSAPLVGSLVIDSVKTFVKDRLND